MSFVFQLILLVIGALLTGFVGINTWILSDLRGWLKGLNREFHEHVKDRTLHN